MNKKQRQILSRVHLIRSKSIKNYEKLWRFCQEPENQHSWDDMKRAEGYADGLAVAVATLEAFIKAGDSTRMK